MKRTILNLARSIAITAVISTAVGGAAYYTNHSFVLWAVIAFFTQFALFYLTNMYLEYKTIREIRFLQIKEAELVAQNSIKVACASCKKESDVIIRTDKVNRYTCGFCGDKNSIYLVAETAIITEPLYEQEPIPNTASTNRTA